MRNQDRNLKEAVRRLGEFFHYRIGRRAGFHHVADILRPHKLPDLRIFVPVDIRDAVDKQGQQSLLCLQGLQQRDRRLVWDGIGSQELLSRAQAVDAGAVHGDGVLNFRHGKQFAGNAARRTARVGYDLHAACRGETDCRQTGRRNLLVIIKQCEIHINCDQFYCLSAHLCHHSLLIS